MPSDLCFVLMPFGRKPDVSGTLIDFELVYRELIAPAVREAWEPETTLRNLRLIREARERRGEAVTFEREVEQELGKMSA